MSEFRLVVRLVNGDGLPVVVDLRVSLSVVPSSRLKDGIADRFIAGLI